ncbi:hypothetical protein EZV62_026350 [Acer yangbiense]|uniref:FBD domain-containing protein n=1 Tax=Acer yangbiense TaxID=1000413 RepID=A0A5C7GSA4_9ROSI|nr:hypothetical protein EZV62_026350 [Acer yangbiense]
MLVHLKEIYLFCMDWNYQDREVIKFLLENSKVLERFSFHTCEIIGDEEVMQDEILNFPRASPICEIEFFDYDCKEKLRSEFHEYR